VLNHKKYCYTDEQGKIQVRSGGIPHDSSNRDMSFKEFVDTQFSDGVEIQTNKSIYNKQETISIYPSITKLEIGSGYRVHSSGRLYDMMKDKIFDEVKKNVDDTSDVLYLE